MIFKRYTVDALIKELEKYKYKQLHIHHTWKPTHSNFKGNNHDAMQESMRNYHMNTRGWSDIGQHLTIFPDGVMLAGRAFNKTPASITNYNVGAFAVEMIGNFDSPNTGVYNDAGYDVLKGSQLDALLALIRYFKEKYGEQSIIFHRDKANKTCPGTSLSKPNLIKLAYKDDEWIGIIKSVTDSPDAWVKAIKAIVDVAQKSSDSDIKILKYLPELVVKLYEY